MAKKSVNYKRQELIFSPPDFEDKSVSIIGLGNIGSHVALGLARLGINRLYLFDPDKLEAHNLSSQAYPLDSLGKKKVDVMREEVLRIASPEVSGYPVKYKGIDYSDILIIAIDTMKGRKAICETLKKRPAFKSLIIDGRIGGSQIEVYTAKSPEDWAKTFVTEASGDPCGGRYICYTSILIGGIITNVVKKHLKGETLHKSLMLNVDSMEVAKNYEW